MPLAYYSAKRIAEHLNISERRIRKLLSEGRFRRAFKVGRDWIIPVNSKEDIDYHPHVRGKDRKPRRGKRNEAKS